MRTCVYDPRRNRWREISPFVVVRDDAVGAALGSSIMVLGGGSERDFDVYDSAQDTWSRQPQLPFDCSYPQSLEVAGRLWCYASEDHLQETHIYDPETRLWTAGPRLPFALFEDVRGAHWHTDAFEVHECTNTFAGRGWVRFCLPFCGLCMAAAALPHPHPPLPRRNLFLTLCLDRLFQLTPTRQ